jgi:hypothetical protein
MTLFTTFGLALLWQRIQRPKSNGRFLTMWFMRALRTEQLKVSVLTTNKNESSLKTSRHSTKSSKSLLNSPGNFDITHIHIWELTLLTVKVNSENLIYMWALRVLSPRTHYKVIPWGYQNGQPYRIKLCTVSGRSVLCFVPSSMKSFR